MERLDGEGSVAAASRLSATLCYRVGMTTFVFGDPDQDPPEEEEIDIFTALGVKISSVGAAPGSFLVLDTMRGRVELRDVADLLTFSRFARAWIAVTRSPLPPCIESKTWRKYSDLLLEVAD